MDRHVGQSLLLELPFGVFRPRSSKALLDTEVIDRVDRIGIASRLALGRKGDCCLVDRFTNEPFVSTECVIKAAYVEVGVLSSSMA